MVGHCVEAECEHFLNDGVIYLFTYFPYIVLRQI